MSSLRFVVHDHKAKRAGHHHDFRLEHDGVLVSLVIPKRIDENAKRLAIKVEDHSLDYIDFIGTIPDGEYGAGTVDIYDEGLYKIIKKTDTRWTFKLEGKKLKGTWVLQKLEQKLKNKKWLLFKQA